jgi:protein phosphatase PTC7
MKAQCLAFDPSYDSPFAKQAKFQGLQISGGKPDDITVLIGVVSVDKNTKQDNDMAI